MKALEKEYGRVDNSGGQHYMSKLNLQARHSLSVLENEFRFYRF
jgi:hypothetical protein